MARKVTIEEVPQRDRETVLQSVHEIGLSERTANLLDGKGIRTVLDLLNSTRTQLMDIPNFGETAWKDVRATISRIGFKVK